MFDKEIEAIAKCTELVKELDDDAKFRVIKYLIERFGIGRINTDLDSQANGHSPVKPLKTISNGHHEQYIDIDGSSEEEYPTTKDLLIKNYPKTETEWILCYAFYSSNYGKDLFKREDILTRYKENNRLTDSARANLNNNLSSCVKKDWIKSINALEYVIKPEGLTYAKEILKGRSTSKEVKAVKRKSTAETK